MKKSLLILFFILVLASCDNGYLETESKEELVVEGWIEDGHAPVVMVSSSLPVSSTPRPVSDIQKHILRYADVYVDHEGGREYLTACISDKFTIKNYFTSLSLRGEVGKTYRLHVKWQDYEASAVCTIPEPTQMDTAFFEKAKDDSSFVLKTIFRNNPSEAKFYQSFRRVGVADTALFRAVDFSTLRGSLMGETVVSTFMKPLDRSGDSYFHKGDVVAIKLASTEESMYEFWTSFTDAYNGSGFSSFNATSNLRGNVEGAIGYWAGYGICVKELVCGE